MKKKVQWSFPRCLFFESQILFSQLLSSLSLKVSIIRCNRLEKGFTFSCLYDHHYFHCYKTITQLQKWAEKKTKKQLSGVSSRGWWLMHCSYQYSEIWEKCIIDKDVACFRHSDTHTKQRKVSKKKVRGWGKWWEWRNSPHSLLSLPP